MPSKPRKRRNHPFYEFSIHNIDVKKPKTVIIRKGKLMANIIMNIGDVHVVSKLLTNQIQQFQLE